MSRYCFDLADHECSADDTGTELQDDDRARIEAVLFAGAYLRDHPELIWDGKEIRVIVRTNESGAIFTVVVLSVDSGLGVSPVEAR